MNLGFVYFVDYDRTQRVNNAVRRVRPDGSGYEDLITGGGASGFRGLAIDWIAGMLKVHFVILTYYFYDIVVQ